MKALSETLSNQETQRRSAQKAINQDVRDRRKARVAGDPGSRDAITQARYAAANGGPLRLNPGQSFLTGEDAVAGRRAYLDQRATTPFMDAMRDRMLMQQGSGF